MVVPAFEFPHRLLRVAALSLALALCPAGCESGTGGAGGTDGGSTDDGSGGGDASTDDGSTGGDGSTDDTGGSGGDDGSTGGSAGRDVVINELAAGGVPADWIELLNVGDADADLTGWRLVDGNPDNRFDFAAGTVIGAGDYMLLLRDDAGSFTFGVGKEDSLSLVASDDSVIDATSWQLGQSPDGMAWGRMPNGTGDFETLLTPTPAEANVPNEAQDCGNGSIELGELCDSNLLQGEDCESLGLSFGTLKCNSKCDGFDTGECEPMPRTVVVNEVTSTDTDRIEFMNPGGEAVDVGGWWVTDSNDEPTLGAYVFPAGTIIEPNELLVIEKGPDHQFGVGDPDKVRLRDASGVLIDEANWSKGEAVDSWCRMPDGTGDFEVCSPSTFGEANQQ